MLKIAVIGNRVGWTFIEVNNNLLSLLNTEEYELISGGAVGVDSFAQKFAQLNGKKIKIIYPDFELPSPNCYYERNQKIVDEADRLIAFNKKDDKTGTQQTINMAQKKGIPVMVIKE